MLLNSKVTPYLIILSVTAIWMLCALRTGGYGVTWDEPTYAVAGSIYTSSANEYQGDKWKVNREHPPLAKILMGVGSLIWTANTGKPDGLLLGSRAAVIMLFGFMLCGVWTLARNFSVISAIVAVLLCAACPRLMGHAQLATLDLPLACFWVWALCAFERGARLAAVKRGSNSKKSPLLVWRILAALFFGCVLLTKFTAVVIPVILLAWIILGKIFVAGKRDAFGDIDGEMPFGGLLLLLVVVVVGGVAVFFAGWPVLWEDTAKRLSWYVSWSLQHKMTPVFYLGKTYGQNFGADSPPWHYAPVMLLVTTPVWVTLGVLLCVVGKRFKIFKDRVLLLCLLGAAALPAATLTPGAVAYDGVRLFLPAIPLLCIIGARGLELAANRMADKMNLSRMKDVGLRLAPVLLALSAVVFGRVAVSDDLSYYSLAVGGPSGAEKLGLETSYWATAFRSGFMDEYLKNSYPGTRLVRLAGFGSGAKQLLKITGSVPEDVVFTDSTVWAAAYVVERKSLASYEQVMDLVRKNPDRYGEKLVTAGVWPTRSVCLGRVFYLQQGSPDRH